MIRMSKKFLGLLLAMVMTLSMGISVFAADQAVIDVTVSVSAVDAVADGNGGIIEGNRYTGSIGVQVEAGTDVETIVREALGKINLTSGASTLTVKEGVWSEAPDWENPAIIYNALNGLKLQDGTSKFVGIDLEDDEAWFGYGWTYSGNDGTTLLNEYNYMSQNTISATGSRVDLLFDYYEYSKN